MAWNPTSPVTGAAVTGLTTPTYTLSADVAPGGPNGKQHFVSALGGTQTGVDIHSISKPFTLSFFRPPVLKQLPQSNSLTGVIKNIGMNAYKVITRKGAAPASGQSPQVARITTTIEIPAGTETYEPEELLAMHSLHVGALTQQINGLIDSAKTGSL